MQDYLDEALLLYSVVFGEGVVNDGTSIVLFNAVQKLKFKELRDITALKLLGNFLYLFFTSTVFGIGVGLLSVYIIKTVLWKFMIWWASLTRAAVTIALAYSEKVDQTRASDGTVIPILEDLTVPFLESEDDWPRRNSLSFLVKHPGSPVHYFRRIFNDRFVKPVFGRRGFRPCATVSLPPKLKFVQ
ncbi:hypothetical protein MLD38_017848 [Melastoma candidum]|uniref:Uncharacterized protein n=1 Tax=Melastoma candidum TaxID=119954 RepID=A0ACB9QTA0_9MYRT|nr:hypothetical protein MLD38_017848 [Melastoma candidum]